MRFVDVRACRGPAVLAIAAFLALVPQPLSAQAGSSVSIETDDLEWVFPTGERMVFSVMYGRVRVGEGEIRVAAIDTVGGEPVYRLEYSLDGGVSFYKIEDRQTSWTSPAPLRSLRFEEHLRQGNFRRDRKYQFDQEEGTFTRFDLDGETGAYYPKEGEIEVPMPVGALDEVAIVYLVRMLPLEVGKTYEFSKYFEEKGNPGSVEVLRRERVRVPAGRFDTIVLRPILRVGGVFGEDGQAELYVTDDERRLIVQMTSQTSVGKFSMYLTDYDPGRGFGLIETQAPPALQ